MKTEIKQGVNTDINWDENPQLVIGHDGMVVMTSLNQCPEEDIFNGIVLHKGSGHSLGHFSDSWSKKFFKPFNGSITLSND